MTRTPAPILTNDADAHLARGHVLTLDAHADVWVCDADGAHLALRDSDRDRIAATVIGKPQVDR